MDRILEIVAHTPLWVWPLFAALLWLGIRAGQTRIVGFNGILTGLFIGWRLHTFYVNQMGPTEELTIADNEATPTDA